MFARTISKSTLEPRIKTTFSTLTLDALSYSKTANPAKYNPWFALGVVAAGGALQFEVSKSNKTTQCSARILDQEDDLLIKPWYGELKRVVGIGAYGKVYETNRKVDGAPIALKTICKRRTNRDSFEREIKALSILSQNGGHPHVCQMYDVHDSDEDYYYVAMEFIEGRELFEHFKRNGVYSESEASIFFKQYAEAIRYIHSKGVVHGDLKLENIMMSSPDAGKAQLKVVDFGSAVSLDENPTEHPEWPGTLAYWPPEMFSNSRKRISPKMDMFATGIIMYMLLTGTHPFDPSGKATDKELEITIRSIKRIEMLELLVFDERTDHLSADAKKMLRSLLHPDPDQRMTSEEFLFHPWVQSSKSTMQA